MEDILPVQETVERFHKLNLEGAPKYNPYNRSWWYSDEGRLPIRRLTRHVLRYKPDLFKERELSNTPDNAYRREWNSRNRVRLTMSSHMYYSLRKAKGDCHWEDLVGYTISDLKKHLENQFKKGMSWDNYGDWEIDHVIPVSAFDFNSPDDPQFKLCWALDNLQPLWMHENRTKGNKITEPKQMRLGIPQAFV